MVGALIALGVEVEADWGAGRARVRGCSGRFPVEGAELFLGNAGTAMRHATFLGHQLAGTARAAVSRSILCTHCQEMRSMSMQDVHYTTWGLSGISQHGTSLLPTLAAVQAIKSPGPVPNALSCVQHGCRAHRGFA